MDVIRILIVFYLCISFVPFLSGALGANSRYRCLDTPARIEVAFPTYKLGCYLFGAEGKHYYGGEKSENVD